MSTQALTYLLVGLSFALYIGIAIWSRAASTKDFYIAGGGIHPLANGMATAADWMSAASFISMAGIISFIGRDGSVYLLGWTGGYVLLALLLAPYLRKFGRFTVPDFIGERYYSQTARMVAVICLIFVPLPMSRANARCWHCVLALSRGRGRDWRYHRHGGGFMYAVLGGMKGITYTQSCPILRADFRLYGTGNFYILNDHRQPHPSTRVWRGGQRWIATIGVAKTRRRTDRTRI